MRDGAPTYLWFFDKRLLYVSCIAEFIQKDGASVPVLVLQNVIHEGSFTRT